MNEIKITSLEDAPKSASGLDAYKMYTSDNLEVMHLHLNPGQEISLHINPSDVVFCVMEGTLVLKTTGNRHKLNKFDLAEVKGGTERGLKNSSDKDTRILVMKKLSALQA